MRYGLTIFVAVSAGCAITPATCPTGRKLMTSQSGGGHAQWCATMDMTAATIPASSQPAPHPPQVPVGVDGPFTSWYPGGRLEAHGAYVRYGARSLPDGLWAFWRPNGQRSVVGRYERGEPTGCFVTWDEHGAQTTGTVQGDQLHAAPCTPPAMDELDILEGRVKPPRDDAPSWGDISVQASGGPNRLGASNISQIHTDPTMRFAFSASARKRFGRLRVGPTFGLGFSEDTDGKAMVFGAAVGWQLPTFHPRIDTEIVANLAAERIDLTAGRHLQSGVASLAFWAPRPGLELGLAFALSPVLAMTAGVRVDGLPARTVGRDVTYCDFDVCYGVVHENWKIGTVAFGANIGLRFLIR